MLSEILSLPCLVVRGWQWWQNHMDNIMKGMDRTRLPPLMTKLLFGRMVRRSRQCTSLGCMQRHRDAAEDALRPFVIKEYFMAMLHSSFQCHNTHTCAPYSQPVPLPPPSYVSFFIPPFLSLSLHSTSLCLPINLDFVQIYLLHLISWG
jgi:hypothetical protein